MIDDLKPPIPLHTLTRARVHMTRAFSLLNATRDYLTLNSEALAHVNAQAALDQIRETWVLLDSAVHMLDQRAVPTQSERIKTFTKEARKLKCSANKSTNPARRKNTAATGAKQKQNGK